MATPGTVGWPGGSEQLGHFWKRAGTQRTETVGDVTQQQLTVTRGEDSPLELLAFQHWRSN